MRIDRRPAVFRTMLLGVALGILSLAGAVGTWAQDMPASDEWKEEAPTPRQNWRFMRAVDSWAATIDVAVPLGKWFALTGAFYRGRALGGLAGGIGQDVLLSGPITDPTATIRGLDSAGGWMQLKFKPHAKLEFNGAFGDDNPFASELRRFNPAQSGYSVWLSKNLSPFANVLYQLRSDVVIAMEYRRLQTFAPGNGSTAANHVNLSLGYMF